MHRSSAAFPAFVALILAMLALGACTTVRETIPQRSATEQLLISTAVDRAAGQAVTVPQIALYADNERLGVAKLAAIGYRTSDGRLIDASGPQFGYAHENEQVVFFAFSWRTSDLPKEDRSGALDFD